MSDRVVNRILLSGCLVSESQLRELPDGRPVCWFRLGSDTCSSHTGYFDVIMLKRPRRRVLPYLYRGQRVLVQGRLESARWEEREGTECEAVAVIAEHVDLVGIR